MDTQTIRQKAEALLREKYLETELPSGEELPQILHELRVYQVELEMQNEELQRTQVELQALQRKYFNLFNLAPVGYFTFNRQGKIVELNLTAAQLLGYERKHLTGKPMLIYLDSESHQFFFEHLDLLFSTRSHQECELTISTPKDKDKKIFVRIDSVAAGQEEPNFCHSTVTDITHQKNLEAETLKMQKLKSVGVLAGGIAHDFNNLLTSLYGNLELAAMFLSPDHKSYKFLKAANHSMEAAINLTTQLLTFSKGGDPIKKTISIKRLIPETAQFSLRGSNVRLDANIAPDLWLVNADKGQLNQVITNLALNAQQAMPTGGTLTIDARNVNYNAIREVEITFQDEGTGIAPKYIDRVFDPYFSTKQQGHGLGLAITHSIISKHNGRITVESEPNHGAKFSVCLPAAHKQALAAANNQRAAAPGPLPASVLVMDDEAAVRDVVGALLAGLGHKTAFANNAEEAIQKYRAAAKNGQPFDTVILDLTIPGGRGGRYAAQEILALDPAARLVVSSGYATDPVMANYSAYGFCDVIAKPYRLAELRQVLNRVLPP